MSELVQEHIDNMAKLSNYRRILEQDYPENSELIRTLGVTLNSSFDELYSALNNRLTFKENMNSTINEFTVTVDSNGKPKTDTAFKLSSNQATIEGLFVINVSGATDDKLLPNSGVFVSFARSENNIIINNIKGLQADKSYKVKVIAIG